jgi:IrrE N-terminal-like domain
MPDAQQLSFLDSPDTRARVAAHVKEILENERQPSAGELVAELDRAIGIVARWDLESVLASLRSDKDLTHAGRAYLTSLLEGEDLIPALRGEGAPKQKMQSTIDALLQASARYRRSNEFRELIEFMGQFRDYAPYNNMLVHTQNPTCGFYATEKDWGERFGRTLKEDARPMLILAPMHPVMLVYNLDQTEGADVPAHLLRFAQFEGQWDAVWLERLVENARRHRIRIDFKQLSSTNAGFATFAASQAGEKMRIAIHADLSEPSRFGVLCHEMAHILLGHLGSDQDHWWPSRSHLGRSVIEIEAEATAYIVTQQLRLEGSSAAYVSRYLGKEGQVASGVSFDMIAKVAGQIEGMALRLNPAPLTKIERPQRR